jgi:thioredoxin 1
MSTFRTVADEAELHELVAEEQSVLVDFHADWCGPCIAMETFLREVTTDATIATVDADEAEALADTFDVTTLPTLLFYADGDLVHRHAGLPERHELDAMVDEQF